MKETKNILLVGVGGQGIILISKILSAALIKAGYDIKMSEVHGMAQRGGAVTTQIRFGEKVYSPIIGKGSADFVVAFEKMEAMRWLDYLKPDGKLILNDFELGSAPILAGKAEYPEKIVEELKERTNLISLKASDLASEIGNIKTMNIIMLAQLTKELGLEDIEWEDILKENIKPKFHEINLKAFEKSLSLN
ncbi:indolepyruvate oxidoreductase subunit beta [Geotoga petraea]|jgi:indolepyruvate ferredoxin oxidoreductase beta subunit|uniref:Indolepyruvate ferredoxin oxidoreductase beta subunit n=1 Tax=Geotoga petraea TaxID=28234 RepID=A0A1G6L164_9BACT|nr:indolepyruvate oxidoreductase subunit beta [Geotoga petraea]TGG88787.1 indolepyruvate oxidoreductase subunit beta [Geotoga petraea]SDC36356.1 indolepyruvate ferredoxin oxidoreductase beta subunit [Geotoga petraea]